MKVEDAYVILYRYADALQNFKHECYAQVDGGIDMDWLMKHAPCNISLDDLRPNKIIRNLQ